MEQKQIHRVLEFEDNFTPSPTLTLFSDCSRTPRSQGAAGLSMFLVSLTCGCYGLRSAVPATVEMGRGTKEALDAWSGNSWRPMLPRGWPPCPSGMAFPIT